MSGEASRAFESRAPMIETISGEATALCQAGRGRLTGHSAGQWTSTGPWFRLIGPYTAERRDDVRQAAARVRSEFEERATHPTAEASESKLLSLSDSDDSDEELTAL